MGVPVLLNIRIDRNFRPSIDHVIWIFTALVIVGRPVTSFFYWEFVLGAGVLRYDADSIGIPIFMDLLRAMIVAIPMLVLTKLALVFKAGPFCLWSWNKHRPIVSVVWSVVLGGPAIYLTFLTVSDLITPRPWPWYEYVWIPHIVASIAWLLMLRGAALSSAPQHETGIGGATGP
jgi:hypothetical protein